MVSRDRVDGSLAGAVALDLSTAALFAAAAHGGARAACVLAVVDEAMTVEALEAVEVELGRVAAAALV